MLPGTTFKVGSSNFDYKMLSMKGLKDGCKNVIMCFFTENSEGTMIRQFIPSRMDVVCQNKHEF